MDNTDIVGHNGCDKTNNNVYFSFNFVWLLGVV